MNNSNFPIYSNLSFDLSGQSGSFYGSNGQNAKSIHLTLSSDTDHVTVISNTNQTHKLQLGDAASYVFLKAVGGNGSNGSPGYHGRDGSSGSDGVSASMYSWGTNGEDGADGGDGGNGGNAGHGGHGGHIRLTVAPEDTALLMLTNHPSTYGGLGGTGGKGGVGGSGGTGGRGGASYSWTTTHTRQVPVTRSVQTETGYTTETDYVTETYYESHSNPGGSDGRSGSRGRDGADGANGVKGANGSFFIHVGDKVYPSRYNLDVDHYAVEDSNGDGILEPGDKVSVKAAVKNIGAMPTPAREGIAVSLQNSQWTRFDPSTLQPVVPALDSGASFSLPGKLQFTIKHMPPAVGAPLAMQDSIHFNAVMQRVNKAFVDFATRFVPIRIGYPVEISPIKGTRAAAINDEGSFDFAVHNISSKAVGSHSHANRALFVKWEVAPQSEIAADDILFKDPTGALVEGKEGLKLHVTDLSSNKFQKMGPSFTFANKALQPYKKVKFIASLHLSDPCEKDRFNCIQQQPFEVQLAEGYRRDPQSDVLLVTNSNTTKDEIQAWRSLAQDLGLKLSIWNTSLYKGISLAAENSRTQTKLLQDFQGKTLVFLNNTFMDDINQPHTSAGCLPPGELFTAAAEHGIKSYVIGNKFESEVQLSPSLKAVDAVAQHTITTKAIFKPADKPQDLRKKVQKMADEMRQNDPRMGHFLVETYAPKLLTKGRIQSTYRLGDVKVYKAPRLDQSYFLNVETSEQNLHSGQFIASNENAYGLLKMLPFEKKLQVMETISQKYRETLKQAILSDLADEQHVFSQDRWSGEWPKEKLMKGLTQLNACLAFDWSRASSHTQFMLQDILTTLMASTDKMVTVCDYLWFSRRQRILASATRTLITPFLTKTLKMSEKDVKAEYQKRKDQLAKIAKPKVWPQLRNPKDFVFFRQDNWRPHSRIIPAVA